MLRLSCAVSTSIASGVTIWADSTPSGHAAQSHQHPYVITGNPDLEEDEVCIVK